MADKSPSEQIDDIVAHATDWRGQRLAQLREIIRQADPEISEAVKWKKPSRPEGVAVWVSNGNLCMADILKNAVRLTFPNGAQLADPSGLFNTRLDSKTVRAVDVTEGMTIDEAALQQLIREAVTLNAPKASA
jgi:hypothetical protein